MIPALTAPFTVELGQWIDVTVVEAVRRQIDNVSFTDVGTERWHRRFDAHVENNWGPQTV